ncbi:MAG: DUF1365 domain-containing protein [Alkalilacustris sp.]
MTDATVQGDSAVGEGAARTASAAGGALDIVSARTFHGREGEVANAFTYGVDYLLVDPEAAPRGPWFYRRNRAAPVALHDRDHGGPRGRGRGPAWAREVLAAHGVARADGPLRLLAQPRVFGGVFNPVSFWLAHDRAGGLRAVIAEVNNTFGDRHSYLCVHADQRAITRHDVLSARKVFHVSPFQAVEGGYRFRFDVRADRVGIWIDYRGPAGRLYATLTGRRRPLSSGRLVWALLRRPFGAVRVLGLIHWQALRLWRKGATFHSRAEPPADEVSR